MSSVSRVWLLVEWVGETNIICLYSVVDLDASACRINNLQPGSLIYLRRDGKICQAKVVLLSESQKYVEDQMAILKSQDERVMTVCIKTITEVVKYQNPHNEPRERNQSPIINVLDVENSSDSEPIAPQQTTTRAILPEVLQVDSSSDESEININIERNKRRNSSKSTPKHTPRHQQSNSSRPRYVVSSSPIPGTSAQENIILRSDQATQTDEPFVEVSLEDIILIRESFKFIYKTYTDFVAYARSKGLIPRPSSERNDEASVSELTITDDGEVSGTTVNSGRRRSRRIQQVRRVLAQTTDNDTNFEDDMVPIGSGHARIPAGVLRDIDWSSSDLATRQLLHAIFTRRELAMCDLPSWDSRTSNEPEENALDPKVIDDIVKTVAKKCRISKRSVRHIIISKCMAETNLYCSRLKLRDELKRQRQQTDENISPLPSSDESDSRYPPRKRNRRSSSS